MNDSTSEFVAIVFADLCNVGHYRQRQGEQAAASLIGDIWETADSALLAENCFPLRKVGENLLAFATTADAAVSGAEALRTAIATTSLDIRIGINCGWVIPYQGDIYGDAVNLASRVKGMAEPGEIVITEETYLRLQPELKKSMELLDIGTVKGKSQRLVFYRYIDMAEDATMYADSIASDAGIILELGCAGSRYRMNTQTPEFSLGRDEQNDLIWEPSLVSRHHAVIRPQHGKFFLSDTSTNGTFVRYGEGQPFYILREQAVLFGSGIIDITDDPESGLTTSIVFSTL